VLRPARYVRTVWPLQRKEKPSRGGTANKTTGGARFAPRPRANGKILHGETVLEHALVSHQHASKPFYIAGPTLGAHKTPHDFVPRAEPSPIASEGIPSYIAAMVGVPIVAGLCGTCLAFRVIVHST
jgi:hypothetical protein